MSISCIIPSFNDSAYLLALLPQIDRISQISQVVVVDDGSDKAPIDKTQFRSNKIQILNLKQNVGKATAVESALRLVSNTTVLLLDADIISIDTAILEKYIAYFLKEKLDQLIFSTTLMYFFNRLSRHNILFAGPRLIRKSELTEVFKEEDPSRYQLEIAINRYLLRYNKQVEYGFLTYQPVLKSEKIGVIRALISNITILSQVLTYRFPSYIWQVLFFGHTKVSSRMKY